MKRSAPLKQTGFKRKTFQRTASPVIGMAPGATAHVRMAPVTSRLVVQPKSEPAEHEGYRRLVAAMPCFFCRIIGFSNAAHADQGKGMQIKSDDRTCYALYVDRPGVVGCHTAIGASAAMTKQERRELEERAGAYTRSEIRSRGLWPADLAPWPEDEEATA